MYKRQGLRLVDEQRIEELEMQWIGNAQIKPTLIGYIEGAPPLPSENLTEEQDYNGATAVELIQSSDVEYSWTREQDVSLGAETSLFVGVDTTVTAGLGVETELLDTRAGMNLSLIHISEPTRPYSISYAVFCLQKNSPRICLYHAVHGAY